MFTTIVTGQTKEFASGMVRNVSTGKLDYLLLRDGPMFERWAGLLARGASVYAPRNWMLASGEEEYERFRESAARHFEQWLRGDTDEDHAAAVFFNINGAEYVRSLGVPPTGEALIQALHLVADHAYESPEEIADLIHERRAGAE